MKFSSLSLSLLVTAVSAQTEIDLIKSKQEIAPASHYGGSSGMCNKGELSPDMLIAKVSSICIFFTFDLGN